MKQRFLDYKKAAEYLGRSEGAMRMLVCRKEIPFIRKGRRIFFDIHDLDMWMEADRVEANYRFN